MTKIGYIVGSLSSTSINRAVFEAVKKNVPAGIELSEIEIKDLGLYSQDHDAAYPQAAVDYKAAIAAADAVVVATPTYNDSFSGVVKNAVDWASRPWGQHAFNGKVTGVAGASIAPHAGSRGTDALSAVLAFGEAKVHETAFNVFVTEETFDADGNFADADLRTRAGEFLSALAANVG